VTLAWIDATSGADTGMSGYGEQAVGVSMPFSFKYYENSYSSVYIVGAGYLSFSPATWDDQESIPAPESPNNVIAPYWTPSLSSPKACPEAPPRASRGAKPKGWERGGGGA
jgi:hypothetical protein